MGAKNQAFDIFQTPLSSHYPLPLNMKDDILLYVALRMCTYAAVENPTRHSRWARSKSKSHSRRIKEDTQIANAKRELHFVNDDEHRVIFILQR